MSFSSVFYKKKAPVYGGRTGAKSKEFLQCKVFSKHFHKYKTQSRKLVTKKYIKKLKNECKIAFRQKPATSRVVEQAQDASVSELWLRLFDIIFNNEQFLLV